MRIKATQLIDKVFIVVVIIKGIDGLLDLIVGSTLLLISPSTISNLTTDLTARELLADPHDFIANHILNAANGLLGVKTFAAFYLLLHGLAKLLIIFGLLKDQLWAYPVAIGFIGCFVVYQSYRVGLTHSVFLAALTAFDLVFLGLVAKEWRRHAQRLHSSFI